MTFKKHSTLTGTSFKAWRKSLALTQSEAAMALGLKLRMVQHYEKETHKIPRTVALACWALSHSEVDFDGTEVTKLTEPIAFVLAGTNAKLRAKKARKLGLAGNKDREEQ